MKKDNFTFQDAKDIVNKVADLAKWFFEIIAKFVNSMKNDDTAVLDALEEFDA